MKAGECDLGFTGAKAVGTGLHNARRFLAEKLRVHIAVCAATECRRCRGAHNETPAAAWSNNPFACAGAW